MRALPVCALAIVVSGLPGVAAARRLHFACVDGCLRTTRNAACDLDGKRDGVCTFGMCPFRCRGGSPCPPCPVTLAVPLGRYVVKRPGLKLVLLCRSSSEIACLVPPTTTTTTTLPPTPAQLIMHPAGGSSVTLSVRGCVAVFPNLARVTVGEFTCEPRAECPAPDGGIAEIGESPNFLGGEATFIHGGVECTFSSIIVGAFRQSDFRCGDTDGNERSHGTFDFVPGQQPPCAPGS